MSFLVPLFLAGAGLIVGPIIAHLIRRSNRERVEFSSTRFFEPSPPRLTRRSRLEHPWLLLLRCLVILVLCAGFARPFLQREIPAAPSTSVPENIVVLVDRSASMQRTGLWEAAARHVRAAADGLDAEDRLALFLVAGDVTPLVTFEQWTQTPPSDRASFVLQALAQAQPGWGPTHLDTGIDAALDELAALNESTSETTPGRILLISDFAEGSRVSGLAARDWPAGCEVMLERLAAPGTRNAFVHTLGWTTAATPDRAPALRMRVGHDGHEPLAVRLQWRHGVTRAPLGSAEEISLAPKESRVVSLAAPAGVSDPLQLDLVGDEENFDNAIWALPPQPRRLPLAFLGAAATPTTAARDPQQPLFYLSRAVEGWRDPQIDLVALDAAAPTPLPERAPVIVVAAPLDSRRRDEVRDRVAAGAFALVLVRAPELVDAAAALAGESNWRPAPLRGRDALLGAIDFQHPLFTAFADPRYSDFTRVRFWQPQPIALPENSPSVVAARFEDGSAAVIESAVGEGRVITWASDWTPHAAQWVLSSKFVPWLQALVERASGGPARPNVAEVGEAARLAMDPANARWSIAGATEPLASAPAAPGLYELQENGRQRWIALHAPAAESRTDAMSVDTWEQLGVPLEAASSAIAAKPTAGGLQRRSATVLESEQKLWRWLLLAAAALLAIESIAAIRLARRPTGSGATVAAASPT